MIALHDVCYVRLGTRDLDTAARFATEVLGLEIAERGRRSLHLRSDARAHTLFYGEGDPAEQVVGFEMCHQEELEAAGAALEALRHPVRHGTAAECAERRVKEFLAFRDPSGNAIELAWRPEQGSGRYRGARDAGITGFSHVGLCSSN